MDTRKVASEYRLRQWSERIQSRTESGQSIKEYCEATGTSRNTYFYWQRKLREAACEQLAVRRTADMSVPGFTEVRLREAHRRAMACGVSETGELRIETGTVRIAEDSAYPVEKLKILPQECKRPC